MNSMDESIKRTEENIVWWAKEATVADGRRLTLMALAQGHTGVTADALWAACGALYLEQIRCDKEVSDLRKQLASFTELSLMIDRRDK